MVAALHDVGQDEDANDEVEGGLGHGHDGIASEVEVGKVSAFGEEPLPSPGLLTPPRSAWIGSPPLLLNHALSLEPGHQDGP